MNANYSTERLVEIWFNVFKIEVSKGNDFDADRLLLEAEEELNASDPQYNREEVDEATGMYLLVEKIKNDQGPYGQMLLETIYNLLYGPMKN